jgi:diguanylate cyclase (GGDEF)-like protein
MRALHRTTRPTRRLRRDTQPMIGGVLFILGGLVTFAGMFAPHAEQPDTRGYLLLSAGLVLLGVVLVFLPGELTRRAPPLTITAAVLACTVGLYINGERLGGAPMFNELFYFWPVLYVGYYFRRGAVVLTLAGIALVYAWTLTAIGLDAETATPRYIITMTSLTGAAVTMQLIRRRVDLLVGRLSELARTDGLTGLLNRRAFDEALQTELERAARQGTRFVLLVGDVDHFKEINDRYGHAAGDRALQSIGAVLRDASRSVDTVARVGGEEFALLLPGTDRRGGVEAAHRLRHRLRATGCDDRPLTMSFGVAEGLTDGHDADGLLRAADDALYAAKAAGRDRIVTPDGATMRAA